MCLLYFIALVLSFSRLALLSSCPPPSLHLVVGGVRCQETREIDLKPRVKACLKATGLFSQLRAERRGEGVEMGRSGMRRRRKGNGGMVDLV